MSVPAQRSALDTELKREIAALTAELESIEQKTFQFESVLRTELATMLIQVQELTVLYKEQKKAKKAKRLAQKRKGKNYIAPVGIKSIGEKPEEEVRGEDTKELKRLYREAMLHVHPDKFSLNEGQLDLATEVTTKLIEIYKSGDLSSLRAYHSHIFSGSALEGVANVDLIDPTIQVKDNYLQNEKEQLEKALLDARNRHTYKVLVEYDDPMTFLEELRVYYRDRVSKLRRRTRS